MDNLVFPDIHFCQIVWQIFTQGRAKKNSSKIVPLSWVHIQLPAWIFMAFIKSCSIDFRNDQSPKCEVVHETKLTSEIFWSTLASVTCSNSLPLYPDTGPFLMWQTYPTLELQGWGPYHFPTLLNTWALNTWPPSPFRLFPLNLLK